MSLSHTWNILNAQQCMWATWLQNLLHSRTDHGFKNKFIIIYLQCCHKSKLNKTGSAWASSIFMMPKLEGCVCTLKRSLSQIQQFHICFLRVQCLPALNRTISCNCHSLVCTWLMSKYSREGKKTCSELQDYWWRAHFQRDWAQEDGRHQRLLF